MLKIGGREEIMLGVVAGVVVLQSLRLRGLGTKLRRLLYLLKFDLIGGWVVDNLTKLRSASRQTCPKLIIHIPYTDFPRSRYISPPSLESYFTDTDTPDSRN
ncbi:hypothetical protein DL98DRAFT_17515 [Cadophora sp. DSE1049]|nr:hypothetical protein DL98DRAFT_17515 [Cadophora sp. DSE1049]